MVNSRKFSVGRQVKVNGRPSFSHPFLLMKISVACPGSNLKPEGFSVLIRSTLCVTLLTDSTLTLCFSIPIRWDQAKKVTELDVGNKYDHPDPVLRTESPLLVKEGKNAGSD